MLHEKSLSRKLSDYFNRLIIAIYRHFRKAPSTAADFINYSGNKEDFATKTMPAWKVVMKVDKLIDDCIATYGVTKYKLKCLYDLHSYELKTAFLLIKHGIVKEVDFTSDKPISNIVDKSGNFMQQLNDPIWKKAHCDNNLEEKARAATTTQDEFDKLVVQFGIYYELILRNRNYTEQIDEYIKCYNITEYLGKNLYDIDDADFLKEASIAIDRMYTLAKDYLVLSYKEVSIFHLSAFTLKKCLLQVETKDYTDVLVADANTLTRAGFTIKIHAIYDRQLKERAAAAKSAASKARKKAAGVAIELAKQKPAKSVKAQSMKTSKPVKAAPAKPIKSITSQTKKALSCLYK